MSPRLSISIATLTAGMLLSVANSGWSQTTGDSTKTRKVRFESAETLVSEQIDGETVQRAEGNVVMIQETTRLSAELVIRYESRDLIIFEGGVEITDEGDTLRADRIEYHSDSKMASGEGGVVWTDGEVELEAPAGEYLVDDKIATFEGGVVMRDSSSDIVSENGVYRVDDELATFEGGVRLDQESLVLFADSLTHQRTGGLTTAAGSVRIYQTARDSAESRIVLVAGQAESERESGVNRLWANPMLVRIDRSEAEGDTLIVAADRLEASTSDSVESFQAMGGARMWRPDLAAVADSLAYSSSVDADSGNVVMTGQPVLWSGEAQVSGDTVRVSLAGGGPDSLITTGNAFVAFEDTASGRIQQIKGKKLVARFRADTLRSLIVQPQAEALYFGEERGGAEDGREQTGPTEQDESAVRFSSSSIRLEFENGEVAKIVASNDVEGAITKFRPENPPALEGFRWLAPTRPDRPKMLDQRLLDALQRWPVGTRED
jgi:lipopolysaccharide export system protein LptA